MAKATKHSDVAVIQVLKGLLEGDHDDAIKAAWIEMKEAHPRPEQLFEVSSDLKALKAEVEAAVSLDKKGLVSASAVVINPSESDGERSEGSGHAGSDADEDGGDEAGTKPVDKVKSKHKFQGKAMQRRAGLISVGVLGAQFNTNKSQWCCHL